MVKAGYRYQDLSMHILSLLLLYLTVVLFISVYYTELSTLHDQILKEAQAWFGSLSDVPRQRILSHFGDFPVVEENHLHLPNGPAWHWWLIAVLPLENRVQLTIVAMSSLKQRLLTLKKVFAFIRSNRTI